MKHTGAAFEVLTEVASQATLMCTGNNGADLFFHLALSSGSSSVSAHYMQAVRHRVEHARRRVGKHMPRGDPHGVCSPLTRCSHIGLSCAQVMEEAVFETLFDPSFKALFGELYAVLNRLP